MTILVAMAMRAEALPIVDALALEAVAHERRWPAVEWYASGDESVVVAVNGLDPIHRVDSIGTGAATASAVVSIDRWRPDWVVSAGTAGGFARRGGSVGQVIVADGPIIHHDRRIPLDAFRSYGRGEHPTAPVEPIARALGFTPGPCSTGDSLDAPDHDLEAMDGHGTLAKDMEAAAVAGVASRMGVPFTALKVITDIVDGPVPTAQEFRSNLAMASEVLAGALPRFLEALRNYDRAT